MPEIPEKDKAVNEQNEQNEQNENGNVYLWTSTPISITSMIFQIFQEREEKKITNKQVVMTTKKKQENPNVNRTHINGMHWRSCW